ncbi:hypothetical protein YPPY63_2898, partial [Yersinia pestis PY-63]
MVTSGMGQP